VRDPLRGARRVGLYAMAGLYVLAGFNHLMNPELYLRIIPPGLPDPEWLNLISGLAEIVLGIFLLDPRTRWLAAWGIIALLVAVFPANLHMALENIGIADGTPGSGSPALNWVRLPLQVLLVAWAWWYTETAPGPAEAGPETRPNSSASGAS